MNSATRILLVLLRLAIGWHLLFAGLAKFGPDYHGSEGYLLEASGPLAPYFHRLAGDRVVDQLTLAALPAGQDPTKVPPGVRCPRALADEWDGYLERFAEHHGLDDRQKDVARVKLEQHKGQVVDWILQGSRQVRRPSPYGPPVEVVQTTRERLAEYVAARDRVRAYQATEFAVAMRTPFAPDKNRELMADKAAVARLRGELRQDIDHQTTLMKDDLREVLTPEQEERGPLPEPVRVDWKYMSRLDWIDFLVRWGLTITGCCLLLGLFSRTACVVGALLIGSFLAAMPPLPGLPEAVRAEGYPFVNKNLVEVLALLTLATTTSGRWAGLDALLYWLNPWRRKAAAPASAGPVRRVPERGPLPTDRTHVPGATPEPAHASARKE
jgi:uncharacterized membrane protein YphA (DoxX/SURF4 family)